MLIFLAFELSELLKRFNIVTNIVTNFGAKESKRMFFFNYYLQ